MASMTIMGLTFVIIGSSRYAGHTLDPLFCSGCDEFDFKVELLMMVLEPIFAVGIINQSVVVKATNKHLKKETLFVPVLFRWYHRNFLLSAK